MAKAILELSYMPDRCQACVLSRYKPGVNKWVCGASLALKMIDIYSKKRADFCPLKEVQK